RIIGFLSGIWFGIGFRLNAVADIAGIAGSLGGGSFLAVDFRAALRSRALIGCSALVGICRLCVVVRFGCLTVPAFCRRVLVVAFCNLAFLLRRRTLASRGGVPAS